MATLRAIWIAAASLVAMALVAEAFSPPAPLPKPVAATPIPANTPSAPAAELMADTVQIRMGTYLGNWERNYYGNRAPDTLAVIWKHNLGSGETYISKAVGTKEWKGAGWTGQPLMVREAGKDYLLQGAYDHHLKKIDAATGELVWQCEFDDVLKGTGTLWSNPDSRNAEDRHIILQGSRMGSTKTIYSARTTSFRGVSLASGKVLWEMNVRKGDSYSRDVDASALVLRDTAYIGLENGLFTVLDPRPESTWLLEGLLQPHVHQQLPLYDEQDIRHHRGNLVVEASPCLLRDHIYVSAGSGHVYGYNLKTRELDWDFYVGSDLDGTPVVTADSCLLITVEQQYIPGKGGVLKLNPQRPPE
ncbi:MAG: PQQ-binding-like beta-propeller repeat protein, partial [Bacteroidota bacterium]